MEFGNAISWVMVNLDTMLKVATSFVGTFAIIATLTPNKNDDAIVAKALDFINFFGGNFGRSKNDPAVK